MPLFTPLKDAAAQSGLRFLVKSTVPWNCMTESSNFSLKETPPPGSHDPDLLPDWSGHRAHRSQIPNDVWRAYCRSNLPKIRLRPGFKENRRQHGIAVEFSL
jgi:hypothetical protein